MPTFSPRINRRARLVRAIGLAALSGALASCQLGELLHAPDPGPPPTTQPPTPQPPTSPPTGAPPVERATRLEFLAAPGVVAAGVTLAAVRVGAKTSAGEVDTAFVGTIEIGIVDPAGATLLGTRRLSAVRGIASFTDLKLQRAGSGYRLAALASGLSGTQSGAFDVAPGAPVALQFVVQPLRQALAAAITPDVQVAVLDEYANLVTIYAGSVTMALGASPTLGLAQLHGTRSVAVVGGRATFRDLSIDLPGAGYTLVARAGTVSAESASFSVGP